MHKSRLFAAIATSVAALCLFAFVAVPQLSSAEFRCGAIALSFKDNKHFGATRLATCEEAERIALAACQEQSKGDCRVQSCRNSCCALAIGPKGTGGGVGSSQRDADKRALDFCAERGPDCKIVRAHCNFGDGVKID